MIRVEVFLSLSLKKKSFGLKFAPHTNKQMIRVEVFLSLYFCTFCSVALFFILEEENLIETLKIKIWKLKMILLLR